MEVLFVCLNTVIILRYMCFPLSNTAEKCLKNQGNILT